jgi:glycosyltransferase involved in cell wall biosynthesis
LIEFLGEISDAEKNDFLGDALALLAPFDWPEPFGLVLIEALACGTPILAYGRGSIPEIVEDGITGFVTDNLNDMLAAVGKVRNLDRSLCRQAFEKRFAVERMARDYLALYEHVVSTYPVKPARDARTSNGLAPKGRLLIP